MWWLLWAGLALGAVDIPYDGVDQGGDGADLVDVDGDDRSSEHPRPPLGPVGPLVGGLLGLLLTLVWGARSRSAGR